MDVATGGTFQAFIAKERERLARLRDDALARRQAVDEEIAEIDRELAAIEAYETAKRGAPPRPPAREAGARRGSRRQAVVGLIRQHPEGLTRGEILERLSLKGNQSGERSVSNALTALKKAGEIIARGRKYTAA
jgi:hypothetical protein